MWIVKLVKPTVGTFFKSDYFPRTLRYKADAVILKRAIEDNGGKATVEKTK